MTSIQNISLNNKKIAVNTIIVYVRIFITMIIGLFASRIVLQKLGASDYGLYNVVGGVVAMFTFITGSLSASTTRFMNYEMGKQHGELNRMFNVNNVLHLSFSIIIFLLLETIGSVYVANYLNVAQGKESDAMFIFQISVIVTCIGIINVPFQSLFTVHENFITVAIIDILSALLKLILVIYLFFYSGNALRFYAFSMGLLTLIPFVFYHYLTYKRWPEIIKWNFFKQWSYYKPVLAFNNYNLLGTASIIARSQGSNILINCFFGTTVNAAYAIGNTVMNYVNIFVGNFNSAAVPQITQNISANNKDRYMYLVYFTCRICILLMILVYFPLIVEIDSLLKFWLGDCVPYGSGTFCVYTLLIAVVSATAGGIVELINGLGNIKWFKIENSLLYLACIPAGYVLFKSHYPAYYILILFLLSDIISRIIQLYLLHKLYSFNVSNFIREAYFRPFVVFFIMYVIIYLYRLCDIVMPFYKLEGIVSIFLLSSFFVFFVGLKNSERKRFFSKIKNITYEKLCKK